MRTITRAVTAALTMFVTACTVPDPDTSGRPSEPATSPSVTAERPKTRQSQEPSQIDRVDYSTRHQGALVDKHALVYLPPGYDEAAQYDVLYYMHGAGMTADSLFTGPGSTSRLKTILDQMITGGQVEPMIVVTPSFYPDDNASLDLHYAGQLDREFHTELEKDLVPAIEGRYSTYADGVDPASLAASRDHRAFGGYSMGAVTTWYTFINNLDWFRYFMPAAGDCWVITDSGGARAPEETAAYLHDAAQRSGYAKDDYLIVATVGSRDGTISQMEPQIEQMRTYPNSFDSGNYGNLRFQIEEGGGHDSDALHHQFETAVQQIF